MFKLTRTFNRLADEDLMDLVRDGESRAFEVIFDRHGDTAYSLAYRMCGSRARAEDVVQEAFLSLWRSGDKYDRTRGSVRSWILNVVHNRAVDAFRREATRGALQISDDGLAERLPSGELTETEVERRDDAGRVGVALKELPEEQRKVIELSYFGGFSHQEIAEILSLPPGTVKGRMRLGLSKLRVSLDLEGALR
jgi:RNA polymerase sigma-70 factor, ECF subfamily